MAEGKGFTRWVRILFDRESAKKAEDQMAASMASAGAKGGVDLEHLADDVLVHTHLWSLSSHHGRGSRAGFGPTRRVDSGRPERLFLQLPSCAAPHFASLASQPETRLSYSARK